jgi:hypothetical protein
VSASSAGGGSLLPFRLPPAITVKPSFIGYSEESGVTCKSMQGSYSF